ncbi:MAG TPA: ScpA family protein [Hyphomicrobiaceae bacterium]|nr:ScpA family protein [Hyphomicrobiaceae bacterium]
MTPDFNLEPVGEHDEDAGESLTVSLDGFEGPLDLLLALARTQKVDLSALSMSALADQYLSFIAEARAVRLELAGDYLVMGAWLAFLKSRLLLPKEEVCDDVPSGEELAARLAFRLMRLEAMRNAGAQLLTRKQLGRDVFPRGMQEPMRVVRERQYVAEIYDLLKAYADQRKRTIKVQHVVKARTVWSIKEARRHLERLVGTAAGSWVQLDMFLAEYLPAPELGRTALASSFGASLELAREGRIELRQEQHFAPIYMRRREDGAAWERIG